MRCVRCYRWVEGAPQPRPSLILKKQVACLYSVGFGVGWSTWAHSHDPAVREFMIFDIFLVEMALRGDPEEKVREYLEGVFPDIDLPYLGGWKYVQVRWLDADTPFTICENEGHEKIVTLSDLNFTA